MGKCRGARCFRGGWLRAHSVAVHSQIFTRSPGLPPACRKFSDRAHPVEGSSIRRMVGSGSWMKQGGGHPFRFAKRPPQAPLLSRFVLLLSGDTPAAPPGAEPPQPHNHSHMGAAVPPCLDGPCSAFHFPLRARNQLFVTV